MPTAITGWGEAMMTSLAAALAIVRDLYEKAQENKQQILRTDDDMKDRAAESTG